MANGVTPDDIALQGVRYARARLGDWLAGIGRATTMMLEATQVSLRRLPAARLVAQQMSAIGVDSLWLVIVVSLFTGAVAAVQAAYQFTSVVPLKYLSGVILRSVVIELGPVLTIYADAIAIFGGYVVAVSSLSVPSAIYLQGLREFFRMKDLLSGLVKAVFFGNIIGMMGCYHGFQTEGGAEGVGRATTMAVVSSCVLILVLDYVLATVLFRIVFA